LGRVQILELKMARADEAGGGRSSRWLSTLRAAGGLEGSGAGLGGRQGNSALIEALLLSRGTRPASAVEIPG